jgi:hypothetical protein
MRISLKYLMMDGNASLTLTTVIKEGTNISEITPLLHARGLGVWNQVRGRVLGGCLKKGKLRADVTYRIFSNDEQKTLEYLLYRAKGVK